MSNVPTEARLVVDGEDARLAPDDPYEANLERLTRLEALAAENRAMVDEVARRVEWLVSAGEEPK